MHTGILRMWSVSKTTPLENFRLKKTCFRSMIVLPYTVASETSKTRLSRCDADAEPPLQLNSGTDSPSSSSSAFAVAIVPPAQVLCTFMDGGVGIYDLSKRRWNFLRELVSVACIESIDCKEIFCSHAMYESQIDCLIHFMTTKIFLCIYTVYGSLISILTTVCIWSAEN